MKHNLSSTSQPTKPARASDNIMSELAAYGIARDVAKEEAAKTGQTGTPVFGFHEGPTEYEITTSDPMELAEYNIDFAVVVPNGEFNLVVRKDNTDALRSMPKDRLRDILRVVLDSV